MFATLYQVARWLFQPLQSSAVVATCNYDDLFSALVCFATYYVYPLGAGRTQAGSRAVRSKRPAVYLWLNSGLICLQTHQNSQQWNQMDCVILCSWVQPDPGTSSIASMLTYSCSRLHTYGQVYSMIAKLLANQRTAYIRNILRGDVYRHNSLPTGSIYRRTASSYTQ